MAAANTRSSSGTPVQPAASLRRSQIAIEHATHPGHVTQGPAGPLHPPGGIGHATPPGLEPPIEGLRPTLLRPWGILSSGAITCTGPRRSTGPLRPHRYPAASYIAHQARRTPAGWLQPHRHTDYSFAQKGGGGECRGSAARSDHHCRAISRCQNREAAGDRL